MKKFITIILFGLLTYPLAFGQTAGEYTAAQAKAIIELDINGLKVLLKNRPSSPTVSAGLFIKGGVANINASNAGIENFALSVASESSKKYPRAALQKELSRTGSSIGAGSNYDFSVISLASTRENFSRSWDVFTDVAIDPGFLPQDVEIVRERLFAGLKRSGDTPDGLLSQLSEAKAYANHPYAQDPLGTIENVKKFTPEILRNYHRSIMQTSRLLLVVVGDFDAEDLKKKIEASFGKLPRGNYKEVPLPPISFSKPDLSLTAKAVETNYVQGVFPAPSLKDPDYYAMRVATTILQSNIYQEVRVKRNLSYAPNAEMDNNASNTGKIYVSTTDPNQAVDIMLKEVSFMKDYILREEFLQSIRGYFLTTYYVKQETNAAQVAELAQYELIGGGWRNSFKFLEGIRKVSPEDINRVSQKYFKNFQFSYLGNVDGVNRSTFLSQ